MRYIFISFAVYTIRSTCSWSRDPAQMTLDALQYVGSRWALLAYLPLEFIEYAKANGRPGFENCPY
jgi:hypothetical protein